MGPPASASHDLPPTDSPERLPPLAGKANLGCGQRRAPSADECRRSSMGLIRWTVARLGPMDPFPLPGAAPAVVVAPAPGPGPHSWAGAPSAALDDDGGLVIAYRLRIGGQDVARTLIAHAPDGGRFTTVATLDRERFGAF